MPVFLDALSGAFRSLFSLRMAWLMIWPTLVSIVLWLGLSIVFWAPITDAWAWVFEQLGLSHLLTNYAPVEWFAWSLQAFLHLALFLPLVMFTALFLTAVFGMNAMVNAVGNKFHPGLERRNGGSMMGSAVNALIALVLWAGLWLITIPLIFVQPFGLVIPFLLATYINQRLFRYDALAIHADTAERNAVIEENRGALWGLGMLLALLQFVPLLNFFAPVFTGLAFIHFCLGKLRERRELV